MIVSTFALLGTGAIAVWTALRTLRCWTATEDSAGDDLPLSFSSKPLDDYDVIEVLS